MPGRVDANLRPAVWEADTLTTKPTRHGCNVLCSGMSVEQHYKSVFHTTATIKRRRYITT